MNKTTSRKSPTKRSFFLPPGVECQTNCDDPRLVFGTATEKWYAVGPEDRDYAAGIPLLTFMDLGESASRALYLSPSLV